VIWIAVTALTVGYLVGRARPGPRLLGWAEDAAAPGWRTPRFWAAAPVILLALAWVWMVHPRRTLANRRSWRRSRGADPVPRYDPEWAARRRKGDAS
jgi:hypothetical protein